MKLLRRPSSRRPKKSSDTRQEGLDSPPSPLKVSSRNAGNRQNDNFVFPITADTPGSRPSSSASANKPLPGLPPSNSSTTILKKQPPVLRKLALSTAATSQPSLPALLPPSAPYSQPASNSSENWTGPEDADGAYIRRTYAHFDASGIKGDGVVEGKEWTRERGARHAWDASESCILPVRENKQSIRGSGEGLSVPTPMKDSNRSYASSANRDLPSSPVSVEVLKTPIDANGSLSTNQGLTHETFAASSSSLGSHSIDSESGINQESREDFAKVSEKDSELEFERREMMKNVDRYGFFNKEKQSHQSTRSRITVLPASSMRSIPKRRVVPQALKTRKDGRGHNSSDAFEPDNSTSADELQAYIRDKPSRSKVSLQSVIKNRESKEMALREREAVRVGKWDRMLEVKRTDKGASYYGLTPDTIKSRKFRKRVYKGIPDRWRSAAWWAILQDQATRPNELSEAENGYKQLLDIPSTHDVQIDLDVPRTISGHILFHTRYGQGQRSLFHVLHAFSLLCPQCAYCQGMGPIVATLLVYFTPEKVYTIMVEMHNRSFYGLHETFSPGFPGLVENFYVQKKLCEKLCPDLITSLESDGVVISSYATKWYITLYTNVLPFSTQLRLWDCFLLQGKDLLVVIAIAILWSLRSQLVGSGFETAMKCLTRDFIPVDDDALLNWIFQVMEKDDNRKRMRDARHEYRRLIHEGKEPML